MTFEITATSGADSAAMTALLRKAAWETNTARLSVIAATTAALAANTRAGQILTASANGALAAQDGVTLALNDRLLVKDEATGANNGIHYVSQVGDGSNPWKLTRVEDADADAETLAGMRVYVRQGTTNGNRFFYLDQDTATATVNTDAQTWVEEPTLKNNAVTNAYLRDSAALSVIGRSANSSGDPADIAAGSDGDVLRRSGTTLGFGAIPESSVTNLTTDLAAKAPLASPTFTGTPAAPTAAAGTSTTQLATTAYVMAQEALLAASVSSGTVQTTDATVTTLLSLTPTDLKATQYMIQVAADKSDHAQAAGYALCATFRRNGGTVTQVGATTNLSTHEDDAAWDCAVDISGTSVRVRITGVAATTINWKAYAQARENS